MSQEPYAPPTAPPSSSAPPQPAPKSNKTLIIVLVLVVLLLCGCCAVAGGGLVFYNLQEDEPVTDVSTPVEPATPTVEATETPEPAVNETALSEWNEWAPTAGGMEVASPTSDQQGLAREIMSQIHPGFTADEIVVINGGYDESAGGYRPDYYATQAYLVEDPEVRIIEYFAVPSAAEVEAGSTSMDPSSFDKESKKGTLDGGLEYVYPGDNLLLGALTDEFEQLLFAVAAQWPGGAVTDVWSEGDLMHAGVTRWEVFHTTSGFAGVETVYARQDGEWVLESWEWTLPD